MNEILDAGIELKSVSETGVFEGYASVFGTVDQGRDAVMPGAFRRSIEERGRDGIKLLWQHDPTEPIGHIEEIAEDNHGLYVKGKLLLDVERAREALALMRIGALDGLSIGFRTLKSRRDEKKNIRILLDLDLWEVSLVTFPMQQQARIASFKAGAPSTIREFEIFLRDAGGLSRAEAKAVSASGFKGLQQRRDADDDWAPVLDAIQSIEQSLNF